MSKETGMRDIFKKISKDEEKRSKEIGRLTRGIKSEALRSLLQVLEMDTLKHAKYYSMIASMMSLSREAISLGDKNKIQNEIDYHIQEEAQHLEQLKHLTETSDNPRIKLVLNMISEDEKRHHNIFLSLKDIIASEETVEEDDMWTMLWEKGVWLGRQP